MPLPEGHTGADRMAHRIATMRAFSGPAQATLETRQNFRAMMRKANKLDRSGK